MAELSLEQRRAIAIARARMRARQSGDGRQMTTRERVEAAKAGTLQMQPGSVERAAEADAVALQQMGARGDVRAPDGRTVAPGTSPEQAARIPEGMVYDPRTGGYVDAAAAAERMGPMQGAAANFISGAMGVGEGVDEAMGAVDARFTGRNPEIAQEVYRQSREQFREARPGLATTLEIGGGVVSGIPLMAGAGATLPLAGASRLSTALRTGTAAATGGAAEGALQGYLAGETPEQRREMAGEYAGVGAGLGFVLGAAAPIVGKGVEAAVRRFKRLPPKVIQDEFGLSPEAARVVRSALENEDLDVAIRRLNELGDDAMLADAGEATGELLDAASKTGYGALTTTREAVEGRAQEVGRRLPSTLDSILGRPKGVRTAAREISDRTANARRIAYDRAYGTAIDYADDAGRRVEDVVSRVPDRTLRTAVEEANDAMREAGVRNKQILVDVGEDGAVSLREMPNVQQLDYLKRALDDVARAEVDNFGRPTAAGLRARRLARDLRNSIADAVPDYDRALRLGGDKITEDAGLELGRRLLFRNTTVEDVRDVVQGRYNAQARRATMQGLREGIEQNLSNVRRTITDPNVDAREAMQLLKEVSSRANREKLRLVLGPERTERLLKELDTQAAVLALRGAVARNSKTAVRESIQGQVADEINPGFIRRTLGKSGNPLEGAQEITEALAGIDPRSMTDRQRGLFQEIAQALTGIRGAQAERALIDVRRALQGEPMSEAGTRALSRAIVSPGFLALYQGGGQALATQ